MSASGSDIKICTRCTELLKSLSGKLDESKSPISTTTTNMRYFNHPRDEFIATFPVCILCNLVSQAFHDGGWEKYLEIPTGVDSALPGHAIQYILRRHAVKNPMDFELDDRPGISSIEVSYEVMMKPGIFSGPRRVIRFFSESDSEAAREGRVYCKPQISDSGSREALDLVRNWYSGCVAHHDECRKVIAGDVIDEEQQPFLPSRVLDMGDEDSRILLISSDGMRGNYAALSYCWGPPEQHPPKTTRANLESRLAGMELSQLPKTFQDAVQVAKSLGLRYLWIDCLCILQDDPADWKGEASKMGAVYKAASVVIAASDSASASEGMFRKYQKYQPVRLPYYTRSGDQGGYIWAEMRPLDHEIHPAGSKLNERAWTTQEYILARRLLYYTSQSIVWTCRKFPEAGLWDDGIFEWSYGRETMDWGVIVREYSRRKLTFMQDKLIALDGVISELGNTRTGKCWYGCWTDSLVQDLSWIRCGQPDSLSRPAELQHIPSWSWASTCGPVDILDRESAGTPSGAETVVSLEPDISGKRIKARGKVLRVNVKPMADEMRSPLSDPCDCILLSDSNEFAGVVGPDIAQDTQGPFHCLLVRFHPNLLNWSYTALLLRRLENVPDTYIRVGFGLVRELDSWVDQQPSESSIYLV